MVQQPAVSQSPQQPSMLQSHPQQSQPRQQAAEMEKIYSLVQDLSNPASSETRQEALLELR